MLKQDTIMTGWHIIYESWNVLRSDRGLLLFPIVSALSIVACTSFMAFLLLFFISWQSGYTDLGSFFIFIFAQSEEAVFSWVDQNYIAITLAFTLITFLIIFVAYVIANFFNAALISAVHTRLTGEEPTVKESLQLVLRRFTKIFLWSAFAAVISTVLNNNFVRKHTLFGAGLLGSAAHMTFRLSTYFVMPILLFENLNLHTSVMRSGQLFKKTWGSNVTSQISIILAFIPLASVGMVVFVLLAIAVTAIGQNATPFMLIMVIIYGLALYIASTAVHAIFKTVLYIYATTGIVPPAYNAEYIQNAFTSSGELSS